jgi:hypothetical protein
MRTHRDAVQVRAARVVLGASVLRVFAPNTKQDLSVSNSWSGGDGELNEVPAVRDPAHMVQIDRDHRVLTGEGQRRVALQ